MSIYSLYCTTAINRGSKVLLAHAVERERERASNPLQKPHCVNPTACGLPYGISHMGALIWELPYGSSHTGAPIWEPSFGSSYMGAPHMGAPI